MSARMNTHARTHKHTHIYALTTLHTHKTKAQALAADAADHDTRQKLAILLLSQGDAKVSKTAKMNEGDANKLQLAIALLSQGDGKV